ncbi:Sesquipedalian-1 [Chlorella vulgaris]
MSNVVCLYSPPEQAGILLKQGHAHSAFKQRYFVLKGSYLFYFPTRKNILRAKRVHGVIPLESAKIETELPPALSGAKPGPKGGFPITITLNSAHAFACQHPFYVLMAPSQEVQTAWCNALWQAAIPRADLVHHLGHAGMMASVLASYATNVQQSFPVADATVLSSGGRARTAALEDVGSLAGMIRRHKTTPAVGNIDQLPMVASNRAATSNVLARTTSGNLVTAPSSSVVPAESFTNRASLNGDASPRSAASSPAKTADAKTADAKTSPSSAPAANNGKQQPTVAVSAASGTAATGAAVSTVSPGGPAKQQHGSVEQKQGPGSEAGLASVKA